MERSTLRIGDLARMLHVEDYVIRFWEKEFDIKGHRSRGGQRYYTLDDVEVFKRIKHLLYEQNFTIAGARKYLGQESDTQPAELYTKLTRLKHQLQLLQKRL